MPRRAAALPELLLTPLLDEEKPDELAVGPPSRLAAMDGGMKDGTYLPDALGPCPTAADNIIHLGKTSAVPEDSYGKGGKGCMPAWEAELPGRMVWLRTKGFGPALSSGASSPKDCTNSA